MRVIQGYRTDPAQPLTSPFPADKWSIHLRFLGGDWLDPIAVGSNWFKPPFPTRVLHVQWPLWLSYVLFALTTWLLLASIIAAVELSPAWIASWPLTFLIWLLTPGKFICWRMDKKGGYAGFKAYGVDHDVYGLWLCKSADIYDGSQALCWTIRPFATLEK
jgi:hypothetical protein